MAVRREQVRVEVHVDEPLVDLGDAVLKPARYVEILFGRKRHGRQLSLRDRHAVELAERAKGGDDDRARAGQPHLRRDGRPDGELAGLVIRGRIDATGGEARMSRVEQGNRAALRVDRQPRRPRDGHLGEALLEREGDGAPAVAVGGIARQRRSRIYARGHPPEVRRARRARRASGPRPYSHVLETTRPKCSAYSRLRCFFDFPDPRRRILFGRSVTRQPRMIAPTSSSDAWYCGSVSGTSAVNSARIARRPLAGSVIL